jgi:hypothetical protein
VTAASDPEQRPSRDTRAYGFWTTALKQIWESVLGADGIAPDDDLFGEWGATSTHAVLACAEMEESLDVALALPDVLVLPTIAAQARALMGEAGRAIPVVARARWRGAADRLPAARRRARILVSAACAAARARAPDLRRPDTRAAFRRRHAARDR